jgi:hypothetical protein
MSLCAAPESAYIVPSHEESGLERFFYVTGQNPRLKFNVSQKQLSEIEFGDERYPLWRPTVGRHLPEPYGNRYRFQLEGLMTISGEGPSASEALQSFREEFHTRIQELLAKRPFEMTEGECATWNEIRRVVNVELYRSLQPVLLRQFGEVLSSRPGHHAVRWEGIGREAIDLRKFPGEFASYCVGQPFEAYVERDQVGMGLRRVFYVKRTTRPTHRSGEDNDAFARSLESNRDLPAARIN